MDFEYVPCPVARLVRECASEFSGCGEPHARKERHTLALKRHAAAPRTQNKNPGLEQRAYSAQSHVVGAVQTGGPFGAATRRKLRYLTRRFQPPDLSSSA